MTDYIVYALTNGHGDLYIGTTTDITRRLRTHNQGNGHWFTAKHRPWYLLHTQPANDRSSALAVEAAWTDALNLNNELPFITFAIRDFQPKHHIDHDYTDARNAARREWQSNQQPGPTKADLHGWLTVTETDAREILALSPETIDQTARRLGIHVSTVMNIRNGRLLAHLAPDMPRRPRRNSAYRDEYAHYISAKTQLEQQRIHDAYWTVRSLPNARLYLVEYPPIPPLWQSTWAIYRDQHRIAEERSLDQAIATARDYSAWIAKTKSHPA